MKKNCLIIGGAGYIGSVLLDVLQNKYNITVFDNFLFNNIKDYKKKFSKIKFIQGDIKSNIKNKHFKNKNIVIHLAGLANDSSSDYNPNNTVLTNHICTIKLANLSKKNKVKKFIYASSCSVYGDHGKKFINENIQEKPLTVYALTKYSSEKEIIKLSDKNFSVIILRFATLFGLSPRMRFDLGVNLMTKNILQKQKLIINGDGTQYRSFVHVKDVAKSISFFCSLKKNCKFNVYNIGSKKNNVQIIELTKLFNKLFKKIKIIRNLKNPDFRSYKVNFDRLSKVLDNKNFISLEHGVIEMYNFYRNTNINLDNKIFFNLKVVKSK